MCFFASAVEGGGGCRAHAGFGRSVWFDWMGGIVEHRCYGKTICVVTNPLAMNRPFGEGRPRRSTLGLYGGLISAVKVVGLLRLGLYYERRFTTALKSVQSYVLKEWIE